MSRSISNGNSLDEMLLLHLPHDNIERLVFPNSSPTTTTTPHYSDHHHENKGVPTIPAVDILETQKEFQFFMDVPGLSKTDIQVTVEDDNTLVIRSNGKRKHETDKSGEEKNTNNNHNGKRKREGSSGGGGGEEEGCKYIRLERRASPKFLRKFRLPENSNVSAITAKCENGVLTITVEKLPPPPKPKKVQVTIS